MDEIGCTTCHVRNLEVSHDRRVADAETTFDSERGIFNELFTEVYPLFGPLKDADPYPQLLPIGGKFLVENVFTDLKRHNLGPNFHERDFDGSLIETHVTEPLWGVATTAPYGHDGRSVNLDAVIRRHGGEAEKQRWAYVELGPENQSKIIDFLQTLVLFPPDDTASSLNPGKPGSDNPQDPANHGNINLGLLVPAQVRGSGVSGCHLSDGYGSESA